MLREQWRQGRGSRHIQIRGRKCDVRGSSKDFCAQDKCIHGFIQTRLRWAQRVGPEHVKRVGILDHGGEVVAHKCLGVAGGDEGSLGLGISADEE